MALNIIVFVLLGLVTWGTYQVLEQGSDGAKARQAKVVSSRAR